MRKKSLLVVGPTPPPYHGVSVATQMVLASRLQQAFQVIHLETADRRGISHVNNPDCYDVLLFVKQWFRNLTLIVRHKPAIYYVPICQTRTGFIRDTLFMLPAWLLGSRVVLHLHGGKQFEQLYTESGRFWKGFMGIVLRQVTSFIVLGELFRSIFRRWTTNDRIAVIPNGVPCTWSPGTLTSPWSLASKNDDTDVRVLFLSTVSREKGVIFFLQAIALVIKKHKNAEFIIAGPWKDEETQTETLRFAEEKKLNQHIQFPGQVSGEQKQILFQKADMFVFASLLLEGQPIVVLEAMSYRLPVIATNVGCLKENVKDGETGFIIQPNNPATLADRICDLIQNPDRRRTMGENGLKRFEAKYTDEIFRKTT